MRNFLGGLGIISSLLGVGHAARQTDWVELLWCVAAAGWCLAWLLDVYPPQRRNEDMTGCSDVCEVVCSRLAAMGFNIDMEDENHDDVLDALDHVVFVNRKLRNISGDSEA